MKNRTAVIAVISVLLFVILGCSGFKELTKLADKNLDPTKILGTEQKVEITVPATWDKMELNDDAVIQVGQPLLELYTAVVSNPKTDFDETTNLEFVTNLIRNNNESELLNAELSDSVDTRINGFNAKRFEITGSIDKIRIKYIFTIIDTPDSYYQIASWTLPSKFAENEPILRKVINSFRLIDTVRKPPPPPPPKREKKRRSHQEGLPK